MEISNYFIESIVEGNPVTIFLSINKHAIAVEEKS